MLRTRFLARLTSATCLLSVLACSPVAAPTAPDGGAAPLLNGLGGVLGGVGQTLSSALLRCVPLSVTPVAQDVGPAGGTVRVGPHTLEIPAGALVRTVRITAEVPSDPVNSVRFGPEGLEFGTPARLTLSYANCTELVALPKRVAYTTESLRILELLRSLDDAAHQRVTAPVDHFSRYGVAY